MHAAREQRKPYVVVFVSVNGVGKSTDLAKVAYWLPQHEINVMMAACDTFRSGVVEQLRTHACRYRAYLNSDLVLFVGEALVGNEAVDQLSKFNLKLAGLSTSAWPRLIDGILLTKFDTIDDKVGAALSMVYISGAPVVFVGCVLSRTDLKKLNVKSIVKTLPK
ncbi:signal recognition particle receptor subunit alpha-like [Carya illinoinensis]|uniref:signal recognition particle receptor subunit alpha-like n=1 Tax=Carya illinoinensis TaxID=32201 RepID=UPI001C71D702|nr:signal recognition particle receptor subunit alpha-like [Carya illinoinensis]